MNFKMKKSQCPAPLPKKLYFRTIISTENHLERERETETERKRERKRERE